MKRISLHKVMAKLAEEQRVELALVDDLQKAQGRATKNALAYMDEADAAKGFLSRALSTAEAALKDYQKAEKLYKEVEAKFKELGMKVPSEVKFNIAGMQSTEMDVKRIRDAYQGFSIRR